MPPPSPSPVSREEFEELVNVLVHELRNRLNGIALEATDLAEQADPQVDAMRLQQRVQECSALLKKVREELAPEDTAAERVALAAFVSQLRRREI